MQKAHDATYNNYWKNLPSVDTPIIAAQLNRNEQTVDELDDRIITLDTSKADQSDMNDAVQAITYDPTDGSLTISKFGGTVTTYDTDIDKIPTSYDFIDNPNDAHYKNLAVTLADNTVNYTDMTSVVTENDFNTSGTIQYSVSTTGIVEFNIVDYSVTDIKMQPNYLADITAQATSASTSATNANSSKVDSEAWAVGTRNGTPVQIGDPTYQNNAKYYAQHGTGTSLSGLSDVDLTNLEDGQILIYDTNTTTWKNGAASSGLLPKMVITADAGSTITITTPSSETITPTALSSTTWTADLHEYGTYVVTAVSGGTTKTQSVSVDYVKIYNVTISGSASVTFTTGIPSDLSLTVGETTINTFPTTVSLAPGEYTVNYTYGDITSLNESGTFTVTLSANESKTVDVVLHGANLNPANNVTGWLYSAQIYDKNYTTVSQVLSDSTTLSALISSNSAVDYLKRSINFASDICANSTAMSYIGLDNYCADALLSDSTWVSAIVGSTYFESVLNVKVPTMTSNITPSGEAFANNEYNATYAAYKAFDGVISDSNYWRTSEGSTYFPAWVGYMFTSAVKIYKATLASFMNGTNTVNTKDFKIQGSNDNNTWADLGSYTNSNPSTTPQPFVISGNSTAYQYWRCYVTSNWASRELANISELQFYGRVDV